MLPRIALFQPDIPGNTGTILRLGACLGMAVDVIEPTGFRLDDKSLHRAGLDYREQAVMKRHIDWDSFENWRALENRRLVLLTTKSTQRYTDFVFQPSDCLLFGRETAGVPRDVHDRSDVQLTIPMVDGMRSLNLAVSVAMVAGEALRQLAPQQQTSVPKDI